MNVFLGIYFEVLVAALDSVGIDLVVVEDKPTSSGTIELADLNGIEVRVLKKGVATAEALPTKADLGISAGFGRLFKRPHIERFGCLLNFHPGIVEQNRGRHGLLVAALEKHEMMGITCHLIDSEEIDAGPIVAQVQLPIDYGSNFDANHKKLREKFEPLARPVFKEYEKKKSLTGVPWKPTQESYFPPLTPAQMKKVFDARTLGDL